MNVRNISIKHMIFLVMLLGNQLSRERQARNVFHKNIHQRVYRPVTIIFNETLNEGLPRVLYLLEGRYASFIVSREPYICRSWYM